MKKILLTLCLMTIFALSSVAAQAALLRTSIGPTLGILNSKLGYGGMVNLTFKQDPHAAIGFGLETGFLRWSESTSFGGISLLDANGNTLSTGDISVTATLTSIPILGSVFFYPLGSATAESGSTVITPYIGLGLGVSITPTSVSMSIASETLSDTTTKIYFMALVKPGIEIGSFFVEPKFGVLKDEFVFLPTMGMSF